MGVNSIALRWPAAWKDPGRLSWLQATPIRHLILDSNLPSQATQAGFTVVDPAALPRDIFIVKGPWPGIRMSSRGGDRAAAGPTGEPWVDSNGWRIHVARAQHPDAQIWVDSQPSASRSSPADYAVAFADATANGGRLIITLDEALATGIAADQPDAVGRWKRILEAASFFNADQEGYRDAAVIGVLSSFTGPKAAFADEVLNNLARTRQLYRAMAASGMTAKTLAGLKGIIYTDGVEPPTDVRNTVLDFVNQGGMLITGPAWGSLPKGVASPQSHPRFEIRTVGKGSVALATGSFGDPYRVPNDAVVLVSHRQDLVRYFNCGAITPSLYSGNGKAALHTVFYSLRPVEDTSVWVRGAYRTARIRSWNQPEPQNVKLEPRDAGVEIHLPAVAQYAMIELSS